MSDPNKFSSSGDEPTRILTPEEQQNLQQGIAGDDHTEEPDHPDPARRAKRAYAPGRPAGSKLDDTQSLPPVTGDETQAADPIQQPFPQQSDVRQLHPDKHAGGKKSWLTPKRKKGLLLGLGFLIALFAGFALAGYRQDQADLAANERQYQAQEMQNRQQKLDQQEKDLQQKRQQLEQQKKELEEQKRSLQQDSDRLAGRQEQMDADASAASTVEKFLDKVTGKEKERQSAAKANESQQAQNTSDTDALNQSLADAQSMLDDVNDKLSDVESMKNEASKVKEKAESTYDENKDVIDTVLYYAKEGASTALDMLLR